MTRKRAADVLRNAPPPHDCGCQRRAWLRSALRLQLKPRRRCCCKLGAGRDRGPPLATQRPLRVAHDFAGKNAPGEALRNLGANSELAFTSEIDKHARETIKANYPPHQMYNDITERDLSTLRALFRELELYLAGWPCQPNR